MPAFEIASSQGEILSGFVFLFKACNFEKLNFPCHSSLNISLMFPFSLTSLHTTHSDVLFFESHQNHVQIDSLHDNSCC